VECNPLLCCDHENAITLKTGYLKYHEFEFDALVALNTPTETLDIMDIFYEWPNEDCK